MPPAIPLTSDACCNESHSIRKSSDFSSVNVSPIEDVHAKEIPVVNKEWAKAAQIFEYGSAANPVMAPIPVEGMPATEHRTGPTRVISLDLSKQIEVEGYQATTPNLLASFLRICIGETLTTKSTATSQAFYVIHGSGSTRTPYGLLTWRHGDMLVVPAGEGDSVCVHSCVDDEEGTGGAGLYWISDAPLLSYLGVTPKAKRFEPAYFSREELLGNVERVRHEAGAAHRNRLGILLGNTATPQTKTLSHTLWSLLNVLPAGDAQRPHRHNSVALDLAVHAKPGVFTLMGEQLDEHGNIIDPIRADWITGAMFVTPPGWWHSHHNESDEDAMVLPMQDAGLYTHQRTLDIRFADEEVARFHNRRIM